MRNEIIENDGGIPNFTHQEITAVFEYVVQSVPKIYLDYILFNPNVFLDFLTAKDAGKSTSCYLICWLCMMMWDDLNILFLRKSLTGMQGTTFSGFRKTARMIQQNTGVKLLTNDKGKDGGKVIFQMQSGNQKLIFPDKREIRFSLLYGQDRSAGIEAENGAFAWIVVDEMLEENEENLLDPERKKKIRNSIIGSCIRGVDFTIDYNWKFNGINIPKNSKILVMANNWDETDEYYVENVEQFLPWNECKQEVFTKNMAVWNDDKWNGVGKTVVRCSKYVHKYRNAITDAQDEKYKNNPKEYDYYLFSVWGAPFKNNTKSIYMYRDNMQNLLPVNEKELDQIDKFVIGWDYGRNDDIGMILSGYKGFSYANSNYKYKVTLEEMRYRRGHNESDNLTELEKIKLMTETIQKWYEKYRLFHYGATIYYDDQAYVVAEIINNFINENKLYNLEQIPAIKKTKGIIDWKIEERNRFKNVMMNCGFWELSKERTPLFYEELWNCRWKKDFSGRDESRHNILNMINADEYGDCTIAPLLLMNIG